jgi:DNA polymerase-3 subunit beta
MEFKIRVDDMVEQLKTVAPGMSTHSTLPILAYVQIVAHESDIVRFATTNLEVGVQTWSGFVQVKEGGAICAPSRLLLDYFSNLPKDEVATIKHIEKGDKIRVKCGRKQATLSAMPADQFPLLADPHKDEGEWVRVKTTVGAMLELAASVPHAASKDISRPTLTGIDLTFQYDEIKAAATDGYRLSMWDYHNGEELDVAQSIIVPAVNVIALAKMIKGLDVEDEVMLHVDTQGNKLIAEVPGEDHMILRFSSRLLSGSYPDYHGIIPTKWDTKAMFDTEELAAALKLCKPFAAENNKTVRLAVSGNGDGSGKITVTSRSLEMGDALAEVEATVEGPEVEIAFNLEYLVNALAAFDTQTVIELTTPMRPGLLRCTSNDNLIQVIMPMHPNR